MEASMLSRQGHRLIQLGVALLLFSSLEGFAIPHLAAPRIGLSVHTLSGFEAVLVIALGLVWPRLDLRAAASRTAFWFLIYSALAILAAYVLGALWGAGGETFRIVAADARGTAFRELVIMLLAYSSALPGIAAFALIFWGLRAGRFEGEAAGR
jgi:hydroxylaminobenzene mutase